jgi:GrpB-like predicted nucleotidyltransferase (UPF0157 family)
LRIEPEDRQTYESVKRALARRDWEDVNHYANAKGAVIEDIMARAEAWAASSGWTP